MCVLIVNNWRFTITYSAIEIHHAEFGVRLRYGKFINK